MSSSTSHVRLLESASRILCEESLSQLSIDRVTEGAGLSRRTFFLHFSSKDQLLTELLAYVRPAQIEKYRRWSAELDPDLGVEERICALFRNIVEMISVPGWRGCCFLRVSAEFGDRIGHPVHGVVADAHHDMERWLESELAPGGYAAPALIAKQLVMLLQGLLVMQLVHRDSGYGEVLLGMLPGLLSSARSTQPTRRLAATG